MTLWLYSNKFINYDQKIVCTSTFRLRLNESIRKDCGSFFDRKNSLQAICTVARRIVTAFFSCPECIHASRRT